MNYEKVWNRETGYRLPKLSKVPSQYRVVRPYNPINGLEGIYQEYLPIFERRRRDMQKRYMNPFDKRNFTRWYGHPFRQRLRLLLGRARLRIRGRATGR